MTLSPVVLRARLQALRDVLNHVESNLTNGDVESIFTP